MDGLLVEHICKNTKRYLKLFYEACDRIMPTRSVRNMAPEEIEPIDEVLMNQRMANLMSNVSDKPIDKSAIPPEMLRK